MARIRTVKPDFFRHYDLFKAEEKTGFPLRLAFAGLWTVADKEGRFKYLPPQLKLEVLPYDDVDFEKILNALHEYEFIEIYEVEGKKFAHIPTFKEHQRITGTERDTESKIPPKHFGNTLETLSTNSGNTLDDRKGREGKGKEIGKEGKGVGEKPPDDFEGVTWDIEKYLLGHQHELEIICMDAKKTKDEVLAVLKKFHLWNQNKENYPKKPLPLIAGLKTWLLNEKKYSNGTAYRGGSQSRTAGGQDPTRIAKEGIGEL